MPAAGATLSVGKSEVMIAATAEAIARAIDEQSGRANGTLFLELPNGDNIAVDAETDGTYFLELVESASTSSQFATEVDRRSLETVLVSFVQGDGGWRSMCTWEAPRSNSEKKTQDIDWPMISAWGGLGCVVVLDLLFLVLGKAEWVGALFVLAVPALLVAAIVTKLREVRRASKWTQGSARILRSELVDTTHNGHAAKLPEVDYEFSVRFDKFRGNRISIGEIMPGTGQAESAIARYTVGASVPVFYNPDNPKDSVLERDVPPYFAVIWVFVAVVTVACLAGALMLLH
jgi:hypothetical protein